MTNRWGFVGLLVAVGLVLGTPQTVSAMGARPPTNSGYFIRVALLNGAQELIVHVPGAYRLRAMETDAVLHQGPALHHVRVIATPNGLRIGDLEIPGTGVRIEVDHDGMLAINGQRVRGDLRIVRQDGSHLRVVNRVDLEDYIASVLVREVPRAWPLETLKAQAIAARTYAVYQSAQRANLDFDVTGDVQSQVYGGRSAERRRTNKAVDATRAQILVFGGDVVPTFFHSTCGGHTEAAHELWQVHLAPLAGRVCPFDHDSPHYTWESAIPLAEVQRALKAQHVDIGQLLQVEAASWTASGRVRDVRMIGSTSSHVMRAKTLRELLGASAMKSTLATLTMTQDRLTIRGHGWGHGVGMCQWGARGMARAGFAAPAILQYYYPGADINQLPARTPVAMTARVPEQQERP